MFFDTSENAFVNWAARPNPTFYDGISMAIPGSSAMHLSQRLSGIDFIAPFYLTTTTIAEICGQTRSYQSVDREVK